MTQGTQGVTLSVLSGRLVLGKRDKRTVHYCILFASGRAVCQVYLKYVNMFFFGFVAKVLACKNNLF